MGDISNECMQTVTARTVNELFREHIFIQSLTFHNGLQAIGYPWGNYIHLKNGEAPDYLIARSNMTTLFSLW
jgi:hypothetical protein